MGLPAHLTEHLPGRGRPCGGPSQSWGLALHRPRRRRCSRLPSSHGANRLGLRGPPLLPRLRAEPRRLGRRPPPGWLAAVDGQTDLGRHALHAGRAPDSPPRPAPMVRTGPGASGRAGRARGTRDTRTPALAGDRAGAGGDSSDATPLPRLRGGFQRIRPGTVQRTLDSSSPTAPCETRGLSCEALGRTSTHQDIRRFRRHAGVRRATIAHGQRPPMQG